MAVRAGASQFSDRRLVATTETGFGLLGSARIRFEEGRIRTEGP